MKKLYLIIIVCLLLVNFMQAAVYIPRGTRDVKISKFLKTKVPQVKHTSRVSEFTKYNLLKAGDGGQLYGIDSISYSDGNGNHEAYEKYYFNSSANLIRTELFIQFFYEENGETIYFYYLEPDQFIDYKYDDNNNLISIEQFLWNDDAGGYVGNYKGINEYNNAGQSTLYYEYIWDYINNDWIGDYSEKNIYNNDGSLTESEYYSWASFNETWEIFGKKEHFYDSLDKNTYTVEYAIDDTGWYVAYWDTSIYEDDNLVNRITYEYNTNDSTWIEIVNNQWTYVDGLNTKNITQYWDTEDETWYGTKTENKYDEYGFIIQEKNYEWIPDQEVWYLYSVLDIFWDEIQNLILSVPEISYEPQINIYPNPVTDYLNVSYSGANVNSRVSYNIYNSIGNLIKSGILESQEHRIDFNDLHKGIYILQIKLDQKSIIKKIIKN
ncbi:T9SS type A sorting domain-containing protein [Bacteroidota bacterium]